MILVQPKYLPSVNFFKDFSDNEINIAMDLRYDDIDDINKTTLINSNNSFDIKVPITIPKKDCYIKDIKIDFSNNWINSHIQSIQSSYGKYPYYIFYIDEIIDKINTRHNFLIDLNYDLLTLLHKFLNFRTQIRVINTKTTNFDKLNRNERSCSDNKKQNIKDIRENFFYGKVFDYKISVIDLLFLKGPESGYYVRNF